MCIFLSMDSIIYKDILLFQKVNPHINNLFVTLSEGAPSMFSGFITIL